MLLRRPFRPLFPRAAADPACHYQDPEAVRLMEKAIVLVVALETKRVEMHVERIFHLRVLALRLRPEEHVRRPAAAADQNALAVDAEKSAALRSRLRCDFPNTKTLALLIGDATVLHELDVERVQLWRAELEGPPKPRVREVQSGRVGRSDAHQRTVVGAYRYRLAE